MKPGPEGTSVSRPPGPFELRFRSLPIVGRRPAGVGGRETGALQAARFGLRVVAAPGLALAIPGVRAHEAEHVLLLTADGALDAAPVHDAPGVDLAAADRVDGCTATEGDEEGERNQS